MDLFWSGKFCSGNQKKTQKKRKFLRSQVRFHFLFLHLLKTMDLFWSGKLCSGNPKKKNKKKGNSCKARRGSFFLSLNLWKTMDLFWSGKFWTRNPKKTQKMVRGAYSVYFTNFREICLLLCCFWQVGSATKKKGAKMIENEGRCW